VGIIPEILFHNNYPHISGDLCISGKQFSLSYHRISAVVVEVVVVVVVAASASAAAAVVAVAAAAAAAVVVVVVYETQTDLLMVLHDTKFLS
jgi:hypothetical protein